MHSFFFRVLNSCWFFAVVGVSTKKLIITSSTQPCLSKISAARYSLALGVTQVRAGGPLDDGGDWTIWDDYSTIIFGTSPTYHCSEHLAYRTSHIIFSGDSSEV